jgi:2-dehydropantoate 2-reductase
MNIAVIGGAGAMGSIIGATLAKAGNHVTLLDVSQEAVQIINQQGVRIEQKNGEHEVVRVAATNDPTSIGIVDLAIVFVKCYHTESAVQSAQALLGPETIVLSLQNGWGNAPRIAALVGQQRVVVGVTYHSGTLLAPGHVLHGGKGMTFLGELDGTLSPRLEHIAATIRAAGLDVTASTNVIREIWAKLALNVCTLPTSALLRFHAGQLIEHDTMLALMRELLRETIVVATAHGIALDEQERWEAITGLLGRAAGSKSSMLQDVERQRRTEIDVINGAIVEAGMRLGIATPYNNSMVWLIKSLEAAYAQARQ